MGIAVIGYGYWSPKLIRNIQKNSQCVLKAICEKDTTRHARVKEDNPDVPIFEHYRDVFSLPDVDAVIIATIPSSHFRIAKQALAAWKHVLIEKPLTLRTLDAELLKYLANKKGLVLMVDHTYLYAPAMRAMKEAVSSGQLGNIISFQSNRQNLGLFQTDTNALWDLTPHDFAILSFLFDERPKYISAKGSRTLSYGRYKDQESIVYLTLEYEHFIAHITVSWISPVKVRQIEVIGTKRTAFFDQLAEHQLTIMDQSVQLKESADHPVFEYKTGETTKVSLEQGGEDIGRMIQDFIAAVTSGSVPDSNVSIGLDVVRMLSAAQESLDTGGRIKAVNYRTPDKLWLELYNRYVYWRHKY
ncbi:MAG: Gfo/Idh/MocA family oxidoreductase [Candidatus Pacebacteria bacterium]|nr:Gfo/Idh/MocA family oxidoreductase [Candidatus Paceibacterota bacterium]